MEDEILPTIENYFGDLSDPRIDRTKRHKLINILVIAICAVSEVIGGQVNASDGKVKRRTHGKRIGQAAIDRVSAWASANRLVLGQVKVGEKSNEIRAIPQLLEALEVAGCIVTIDAMGSQTRKPCVTYDALPIGRTC